MIEIIKSKFSLVLLLLSSNNSLYENITNKIFNQGILFKLLQATFFVN